MAHPWHHALSSVRKFGGTPEDYIEIHNWFDATKASYGDFRHRALRHHAAGIFEMEKIFGVTITNSDGKVIPTRFIGEQHVREDCGGIIPSAQDWLRGIPHKSWMTAARLSKDMIRLPEGEELDLSLEAWRAAVAAGETTLGHIDWATRLPMTVVGADDTPADGRGISQDAAVKTQATGSSAEIVELREALKPFAELADTLDVGMNETGEFFWAGKEQNQRITCWMGPTDFGRARAAMKSEPQEEYSA